ncbi:RNA-binding domain-containing protein [Runella zeae]|uniref:RNA-binding domain-containing protein n=1 Tax=Runella zeae TaxID=94255 RepID=UPI00041E0307|nr:RNA-binding domain-containing protein [Runella zeae]
MVQDNRQLSLFDFENQPIFVLQNEVFPEVESFEVEFKSALGGLPQDLWKTYSAFANSQGGIIALGIVEKKNVFTIEGLGKEHIEKLQRDFWNQINNRKAVSKNILENQDVKVCLLEGKEVLAINVPVATRTQKPVFLTTNPFGNTYKRNHEGDYHCTDDEVRRMLADADLTLKPDGRMLAYHNFEDFDATSIRQYKQLLSASKPDHPWLTLTDKEFLIQLGAYTIDRKTRKEGPTVAGMLMFGKTLSIVDDDCCPKFFPDYREYFSDNPADRWTDRVYPDGTWEANLFQFYRQVWPKLSSKLPKPFQLYEGRRVDETLAHEALREAFINSLVHTDYTASGNIVIESRLETFLFVNPGTLLVSLDQYYQGGVSECRNNNLQKMFMMIGSAEKAGSGVGKILAGWKNAHWRRPFLYIESKPDRLELHLPMLSTIPDDTLIELRILFGDEIDVLGGDELTVLATCQIEGDITNQRLQYLVDKHKTEITKLLQDLCKRGLLVSDNKGRWTTYHLNKQYRANDSSSEDSSSEDSSNEDSSSEDSSNEDSSTKKRLTNEELIAFIEQVCAHEYMSLEEIAKRVGKSTRHLINRIIPRMIEMERLVKLYHDNHPNQKYKTRES